MGYVYLNITFYPKLLDSICNMEIVQNESSFSTGLFSISDDKSNITTIICVGIITAGIVALGITAMVIFGRKRKNKNIKDNRE